MSSSETLATEIVSSSESELVFKLRQEYKPMLSPKGKAVNSLVSLALEKDSNGVEKYVAQTSPTLLVPLSSFFWAGWLMVLYLDFCVWEGKGASVRKSSRKERKGRDDGMADVVCVKYRVVYHKDMWNEKDYSHEGLGKVFKTLNGDYLTGITRPPKSLWSLNLMLRWQEGAEVGIWSWDGMVWRNWWFTY